ncbi:ATP-dependent DNA helicase RecG [Naumannella halotolerans]|uniref:Probable DNA 3'-5' helicase RecG n=1 Tax=Naumannella halotolerans TaxID=993414 RepID=A0A4R7J996_9ACTN|nr:ATP-dependent DNA helicase RecG [Naumannella halotolerans]TDT32949.1 ATP-dependent DNA helicase RecG [Naumannella halotolerans]
MAESSQVAGSPWRTDAFRRLNRRVGTVLGEKAAKGLAKLAVHTLGDLARHVPRRYLNANSLSDFSGLRVGEDAVVAAEVVSSKIVGHARKQRLEATVTDGVRHLRLTFFGREHMLKHWSGQLQSGTRAVFAGKVGEFRGDLQLSHPNYAVIDDSGRQQTAAGGRVLANKGGHGLASVSRRRGLIGIYPSTASFGPFEIAEFVSLMLHELGGMQDPLPPEIRERAGVIDLYTAIEQVHMPTDHDQVREGMRRLRFDEALGFQLAMAYRRAATAAESAVARPRIADGILSAFDARLPFTLTGGQQQVGEQIFDDLAATVPMQRLLQGEVGSGKTLVALRAMLAVVDAGGQAVLLAPTEVLARQHYESITRMLGDLGEAGQLTAADHATRVALLTGSMSAVAKRNATLRIASGEAGIVVGTHALLTDTVQFADLGLVVVDEQHRFGVEQRAALGTKAEQRPHVLVMTATPIPRTVAMTVFGDLEVSTLTEVPAGRAEVQTVAVDEQAHPNWVDRAWQRIAEEVAAGRQAFVVCPRISETDKSGEVSDRPPSRTVVDLYEELRSGPLKQLRVGMLHGQLPAEEKDAVMQSFADGDLDVLVATTVIEVGVDVPNASVMVITDADRFGISQLHQLRGRIGRGQYPGVCLLLTAAGTDTPAWERLSAVAATRDGFELADVDLAQRREGDVLGASQAGARSTLRLLRVIDHAAEIELARTVAVDIVDSDPDRGIDGVADLVTQVEKLADAEWLDRS